MPAPFLRALLAAIVLLSYATCPSAQGSRVVARVNGDEITDLELQQRITFAIRYSGMQDSADLQQCLAPLVLRRMIDERLQTQNSQALRFKPADEEVNQRVVEIERAAGLQAGQFKQYLQSIGVPYEIVSQQIAATIAWTKIMRRKVRPTVDVSDAEIDDGLARIRANPGKAELRVAEIFLPIDRVEQADEAKRGGDCIVEWLRRGAAFPALAQQFSHGTTAQQGGDLGWFLPGSLDPALEAAIEKLPLRQASEPIRSPAGYHILLVDRPPVGQSRPEEVKLNLVQMTLALPVNASADEVARATAEAQKAMAGVRSCEDLQARARDIKGATSGMLTVLVGQLAGNREMYDQIPKLAPGGTAGPFRVAEGLQVVALCNKEAASGEGGSGLPGRDEVAQQIQRQKLEAASRRYMRDLRRAATIETVKQP
jgi:peptidyl-prolyl cis-trans isomerase SurA